MPVLYLSRERGYADCIRAYKVLIDGSLVGKIRSGERKQFDVAPGSHTLEVKIDWCTIGPESFFLEDGVCGFRVFSKLRGWRVFLASNAAWKADGWIGLESLDGPAALRIK